MQRILRALVTGGTAAALIFTVAGCGSGTAGDSAGDTSGGAKAGGGKITVDTAQGKVSLDKAATKVVSLEWTYAEELVALGVPPVGNADNKGYGTWITAKGAGLPDGVTDVGDRNEPSLEKIRALNPDLIVIDNERSKANLKALQDIAPVVAFTYTTQPQLETMKKNFTELAKAVGKEDKATEVTQRIETEAAGLRTRLEKADKGGLTYTVAQGFTANGTASMRLLTDDAITPQVLNLAGLKNGWKGKGDAWGMTTVGVEGLTKADQNSTFLYVASEQDNPFTGDLADNAVWKGLKFVKDDKVLALDPGTWLFGGPLSALHVLDETGKALKV
ncbi:ABC transporter substrate-binding protein [Streptomyces jumonjinensis]|uniref:Iron-siderophore ABC transporter substrate-binding protein n=1 Tax=Streptomyces jumonjinensis TaxID=1945 RepID=A0A646K9D3_STRJU|nr:iron-siderophore ABC transporter substrate-binding protein [Streptomyces jumonjinensis]MQS98791.1 iron-siderophore ABC transporter substrate-binding protein [Streptomyces jumonjinensis]